MAAVRPPHTVTHISRAFWGLNRFIELRAESPGVGRLWGQLSGTPPRGEAGVSLGLWRWAVTQEEDIFG